MTHPLCCIPTTEGRDYKGRCLFVHISQKGLVVGVELRVMEAAAEVMPAAVGGAGTCFLCAVTKGLMRGVLSPSAAISVFRMPMSNNFVALMGVWLLGEGG